MKRINRSGSTQLHPTVASIHSIVKVRIPPRLVGGSSLKKQKGGKDLCSPCCVQPAHARTVQPHADAFVAISKDRLGVLLVGVLRQASEIEEGGFLQSTFCTDAMKAVADTTLTALSTGDNICHVFQSCVPVLIAASFPFLLLQDVKNLRSTCSA